MKKIESTNDLLKLKESFNNVFDKRIKEQRLMEKIDGINKLNFNELKTLFEGIGYKLFDNNKNIIANYIKTIKENEDLKSLYLLHENVVKPSVVSDANLLVSSMISLSESFDRKSLNSSINKLRKVVSEGVLKSGIDADEFDKILENRKDLNESLNYILTNKRTAKNLYEYTDKTSNIVKYINEGIKNIKTEDENKTPIVFESKEDILNAVKNLNESLRCENDWETEAVKDLTLCIMSESSGEKLFNEYKQSCLDLLNEKIEDADNIEEKARFSSMKESLDRKVYESEKLKENILKLAELKYTLTE